MTFSKCTFIDILKNVLTRGTPEYRARNPCWEPLVDIFRHFNRIDLILLGHLKKFGP